MRTHGMKPEKSLTFPEYTVPPLPQKIRLYALALVEVPFYRYGEIGNLLYTVAYKLRLCS